MKPEGGPSAAADPFDRRRRAAMKLRAALSKLADGIPGAEEDCDRFRNELDAALADCADVVAARFHGAVA